MRRAEVALLIAVVALGAALRLLRAGADVPLPAERSDAPIQDAFWYLEAATGPVEGLPRDLEPHPAYDPPVWVQVARVWFALAGVSLGSAQALGALVSLATVLLVWRLVRAALGPVEGLVAAAVLATLYPFVWLSRTTLVYGPAALALTVAVALAWAGGRPRREGRAWVDAAAWLALALAGWTLLEMAGATPLARALACAALGALVGAWRGAGRRWGPDVAHRALTAAAAWSIVGAAALALRPPALAAAGGLALMHAARARRPLRAVAMVVGTLALAVAVVAVIDPAGIRLTTLDRLERYLRPDALSPAGIALRALRLGGEPHGMTGSGYVALAPGACLVAALGALAAASRPTGDPRRRDAVALFGGWAALFLLGAVVLDHRPLRYFAVLGPPVAVFSALALGPLLREAGPPAPALRRGLALTTWGAIVGPHALELVVGPRGLGDLLPAAAGGAATALGVGALARRIGPDVRRGVAWLLVVAAIAPGALRAALDLSRPGWLTREANEAAREALGPEASLVGPHASVLALGHGIERRRASWIDVSPDRVAGTVARLRQVGATHVALGIEQATSSRFVDALTTHGERPDLVGIFTPRGTPVLLLRLPWAEEVGYRLSAFEQRRAADQTGGDPVAEVDARLLLARVRALAFQGASVRAGALVVASQATLSQEVVEAARRAILGRGLR